MRAIIEIATLAAEQRDEGFVHEPGRRQRLSTWVTSPLCVRDLGKLVVNEREQAAERIGVALAHLIEQQRLYERVVVPRG